MKSNSNGEPAYSYTINSKTSIGTVAIKVSSLEQSSLFYQNVLGLQQLARSRFDTTLGVDDTPLIHLTEIPDAKPKPRNSTGLYHLGILLPIRRDLARFLTHLLSIRYPLEGAADHVVSESLYFDDPDIIGIEVYSDRHREDWSLIDESENLRTNPLNAEELLSLVKKSTPPWRKAPGNTRIGHVHLLVNDLEAAEWFYSDILGFELKSRYQNEALFLAAGDYHHHIAVNIWAGMDAPPPPENAVGLDYFSIRIPDQQTMDGLIEHLDAVNIEYESRDEAIYLRDPSGNLVLITSA